MLLFGFSLMAQVDSVQFTNDFRMREGIYLSYADFRNNTPLDKATIKSKANKEQLDFFGKLLDEQEEVVYVKEGKENTVLTDILWGYCQNSTIYIMFHDNFCRIPLFGNLSRFVGIIEIARTPYYGPGITHNNGLITAPAQVKTRETRQFIFDFYTGEFWEYGLDNLKEILIRDPKLYAEFTAYKRRKQKKLIPQYIRKYNEAHPVSFPKN